MVLNHQDEGEREREEQEETRMTFFKIREMEITVCVCVTLLASVHRLLLTVCAQRSDLGLALTFST